MIRSYGLAVRSVRVGVDWVAADEVRRVATGVFLRFFFIRLVVWRFLGSRLKAIIVSLCPL